MSILVGLVLKSVIYWLIWSLSVSSISQFGPINYWQKTYWRMFLYFGYTCDYQSMTRQQAFRDQCDCLLQQNTYSIFRHIKQRPDVTLAP